MNIEPQQKNMNVEPQQKYESRASAKRMNIKPQQESEYQDQARQEFISSCYFSMKILLLLEYRAFFDMLLLPHAFCRKALGSKQQSDRLISFQLSLGKNHTISIKIWLSLEYMAFFDILWRPRGAHFELTF